MTNPAPVAPEPEKPYRWNEPGVQMVHAILCCKSADEDPMTTALRIIDALAAQVAPATATEPADPMYSENEIAQACMFAEVSDGQFESVLIALQDARAAAPVHQVGAAGPETERFPHVGADDFGCATLEWWNGERKLTLYCVSNPHEALLKSWGPNTQSDMAFVDVLDAHSARKAFEWLAAAPSPTPKETP